MSNRKVNRVKSRKVNEAKTGPGTMGVVRDLLDVMNKNGLTKIHVTKSTLEAMAAGEVVATTDGNKTKFAVGNPNGFSTLESVGRRHRVSTKGNRFRRVNESSGSGSYVIVSFPRNEGSYSKLDSSEVNSYKKLLQSGGVEVLEVDALGYDDISFYVKATLADLKGIDYSGVPVSQEFLDEFETKIVSTDEYSSYDALLNASMNGDWMGINDIA